MRATELLIQQFTAVNTIFHDIADDLTEDEWTRRIISETNLLGFDLWHVARTQDWAAQTLARGVPEVIIAEGWRQQSALATPGIGVGMTRDEADALAHAVDKSTVLAYADAVHQAILAWLTHVDDSALDTKPDIDAHLATHPEYTTPAMRMEVPWLTTQPPLWRCLAPANAHVRDHLAEMALVKRQLRLAHVR